MRNASALVELHVLLRLSGVHTERAVLTDVRDL